MIHRVKGDASCPQALSQQMIVAHICSDIGLIGSNFSEKISKKWPEARERFLSHPDRRKLGSVILSEASERILIAHMVSQRGIRSKTNPHPVSVLHLRTCLEATRRLAETIHATIHIPSEHLDDLTDIRATLDKISANLDIYIYEKLRLPLQGIASTTTDRTNRLECAWNMIF